MADDDVRIAFQDFGAGPPAVFAFSLWSHLEGLWEQEMIRRMWERMGANLRVILFDQRGTGMSDGFIERPDLDRRTLDIKAVLDRSDLETASIIAFDAGAPVATAFAASSPARVARLVLVNSRVGPSAKPLADELNPDAIEPKPWATPQARVEQADLFGIEFDDSYTYYSPSMAKYPDYMAWGPLIQRLVGTRDSIKRQIASFAEIDATEYAPRVEAPTLISHANGNRMHHVGYARLLAELIPNSTLDIYEGEDQDYWLADDWQKIVDSHISFVTDAVVEAPLDRRFAVVLFTDIVASTKASLASGDDGWRRSLDTHERISQKVVVQMHSGTIIKNTGDGLLAVFSAPSQAVEAATRLVAELSASGIQIRAGIHAGEVEVRGDDIAGAVVNLTARVEQTAADGDIYTTSTIKDMLIGSIHKFESVGSHRLKGFDGDWPLFRIVRD